MELLLVHLGTIVIFDMSKLSCSSDSFLQKLLNDLTCNPFEKSIVFILEHIYVEDAGLAWIVSLHTLETCEGKFDRLWVLAIDRSKDIHLDVAFKALQYRLR